MVRRLVLRYNDSFYSWGKGDLTSKEGRINYDKVQQIENNIKAYENEAKQVNKLMVNKIQVTIFKLFL